MSGGRERVTVTGLNSKVDGRRFIDVVGRLIRGIRLSRRHSG